LSTTLPLTGGRKKAEPRPRSEGLCKLAKRRAYYARLYPPGAKRARYFSTHAETRSGAEAVLNHVRAEVARRRKSPPPSADAVAPELDLT
jgi:hypothetical protein